MALTTPTGRFGAALAEDRHAAPAAPDQSAPAESELVPGSDPSSGGVTQAGPDGSLVVEELLVEDVSIDGMCGVY